MTKPSVFVFHLNQIETVSYFHYYLYYDWKKKKKKTI